MLKLSLSLTSAVLIILVHPRGLSCFAFGKGADLPEKSLSKMAASAADVEWGSIANIDDDKVDPTNIHDQKEIEETVDLAIIGGGIAGLSLAAGLASLDHTVRLYERAPQLRTKSQGMLVLRNSGLQSLAGIHPDLPAAVREVGAQLQKTQSTKIDADGNAIGPKEMQFPKNESEEYDALITWSDLQNVLASFIPDSIKIVTGSSLHSYEETTDWVILTFDDGKRVRCRAIVGCDGIFSRIRRQMYDDKAIYFGQLNWNAIVPTESLLEKFRPPQNSVTLHSSKFPWNWSSFVNDTGSGKTFWQIRVSDPEKALALSGSSGRGGLGLAGTKGRLMRIVEQSEVLSAVLECTPEEEIFERCILGRKPAPGSWRSKGGRVVLMGDAAHAMHPRPGYGGNSAIQGAFTLKTAISECNDFCSAFEMYEHKYRKKVDIVQKFSNYLGCGQANGEDLDLIPNHLVKEMSEWMSQLEPVNDIPPEVMNVLDSFDPLDVPGVSYV